MNKHKTYLPTNPAPLPYKGAPLDAREMIARQIQIDDAALSHIEYVGDIPPERELPARKPWSLAVAYAVAGSIYREARNFAHP